MRSWMKILPKRVRHWYWCRHYFGFERYCIGHGKNIVRFGSNSIFDEPGRNRQVRSVPDPRGENREISGRCLAVDSTTVQNLPMVPV